MRYLLCVALLCMSVVTARAAVTMAVSGQAGAPVQERAAQLARQLGGELGTTVKVVTLADDAQVEAWLNRYATADLALVESAAVSRKPGQFVVIGPAGRDLTLIGRQGIGGDLPQKLAGILNKGVDPVRTPAVVPTAAPPAVAAGGRVPAPAPAVFTSAKSAGEDRYFVGYVYREKLGIEPELERLDYWTRQLQDGTLSRQQLYEMACRPGSEGCRFR